MKLSGNKYIPKRLLRTFSEDQWTMEQLATTQVRRLIQYRGIGPNVAQKIIGEAARLVNEAKAKEAEQLDPQPAIEPAQTDDEPVSARVKRIKEQNQ